MNLLDFLAGPGVRTVAYVLTALSILFASLGVVLVVIAAILCRVSGESRPTQKDNS